MFVKNAESEINLIFVVKYILRDRRRIVVQSVIDLSNLNLN
jgi:hypothetical protein